MSPFTRLTHPLLRFALVFLVLPNLAFFIAGQFVYTVRPLINLDYVFLGFAVNIVRDRRGWLTAAGYTVVLLLDLVGAFAGVYYFQLDDVLSVSLDVLYIDRWQTALVTSSILICAAGAAWMLTRAVRTAHLTRRQLGTMAVAIVLLAAIDGLNGTNRFLPKGERRVSALPVNLTGSLAAKFGLNAYALATAGEASDPQTWEGVERASSALSSALLAGADSDIRHVVLIVVESLGLFRDPGLNEQVWAALGDPAVRSRYAVLTRDVPFNGSTTDAELRELCGRKGAHTGIKAPLTGCLPWEMQQRGFSTLAMHGFTRSLFSRQRWYPHIGFQRLQFAEEMFRASSPPLCGSMFRGVCDADVATMVRRELVDAPAGDRRFIYWLTLNSHLPVDEESAVEDAAVCRQSGALGSDDVCLLFRIWRGVFTAIAAIASDSALPATRFLIVGDHAPAFFSVDKRHLFADGRVPVVELVPRRSTVSAN